MDATAFFRRFRVLTPSDIESKTSELCRQKAVEGGEFTPTLDRIINAINAQADVVNPQYHMEFWVPVMSKQSVAIMQDVLKRAGWTLDYERNLLHFWIAKAWVSRTLPPKPKCACR